MQREGYYGSMVEYLSMTREPFDPTIRKRCAQVSHPPGYVCFDHGLPTSELVLTDSVERRTILLARCVWILDFLQFDGDHWEDALAWLESAARWYDTFVKEKKELAEAIRSCK